MEISLNQSNIDQQKMQDVDTKSFQSKNVVCNI